MSRFVASFLITITIVFGCLGGDGFKFSSEFYKLLETTATEDMTVDAVFEHELVNGDELYRMSRRIMHLSQDLQYSRDEKIALSHKGMILRKAFTEARTLAAKSAYKPTVRDNIRFIRRPTRAVKPLLPDEWMVSDLGKKKIAEILSAEPKTFKGLVDYLLGNDETKFMKISFGATLNRIPPRLKEATLQEQMNWIYRAYVVMNKTAPKDNAGKRGSKKERKANPVLPHNENGRPPVKPYRVKRM